MAICAYTPSAEHPTYADYRKAKQREYRKAWKQRNAEAYRLSELARVKKKYATDSEYRETVNRKSLDYYRLNPEPAKLRSRKQRLENKEVRAEYDKSYYQSNKPSIQAYKAQWAKTNASRVNQRNAARRALCSKATPAWADKNDIADAYLEARHMRLHVDHIVPLNHPLVCGLHVWDNLQLLTPIENMRKNNRFDPETFNAS